MFSNGLHIRSQNNPGRSIIPVEVEHGNISKKQNKNKLKVV